MIKETKKEAMLNFLKKNVYAIVAGVILIVLGITLALIVNNKKVVDNNPDDNVNAGAVTFYVPLLNATVEKEFSDTKLMYNETLKQWEAHMAIQLVASDSSSVYAALEGTVLEMYENYLEGKVIVLQHANNLKTVYKSLGSTSDLQVGDTVSKGQVIGTTRMCASELDFGNHLHFEVEENDKKVDPAGYLNLTDK